MENTEEPDTNAVLIISDNVNNDHHKYRGILSQILAVTAASSIILNFGMMFSMSTIIIGELHNSKENLSLNDSQSSWFGSLIMVSQPLGCLFSSFIQGTIGWKKSMLLINIPNLLIWYMAYSAKSVNTLYLSALIAGFDIGLMDVPILSYIGEVSESKFRAVLLVIAYFSVTIGHILEFLIEYIIRDWRWTMLVSGSVPVISTIVILMIPESPIWLLTNGKTNEAMSSLRWLRGWVSIDNVKEEFKNLELYCQTSKNEFQKKLETKIKTKSDYCNVPGNEIETQIISTNFIDHIKDFCRPAILKPLRLVIIIFLITCSASLTGMRPYIIEIYSILDIKLESSVINILNAMLQFTGGVVFISLVRVVGKKFLCLVSASISVLCCLSLAAYTYIYVANRYLEVVPKIPMFLISTLFFSIGLGVSVTPWILITEVFPNRGRGVASGICGTSYYMFSFTMIKTWLNLQYLIGLSGCFFVYGLIVGIGIFYIYFSLPETDEKPFTEIEKIFAKKN